MGEFVVQDVCIACLPPETTVDIRHVHDKPCWSHAKNSQGSEDAVVTAQEIMTGGGEADGTDMRAFSTWQRRLRKKRRKHWKRRGK